jgi:hypothetical protein
LIANETIARLIASPKISGTIDIGGKDGAGILTKKEIQLKQDLILLIFLPAF